MLTILRRVESDITKCVCLCECGTEKVLWISAIKTGATKSCGCVGRPPAHNKRHGMAGTPTYKTWLHMRDRCSNPRNASYKDYGARGITVCERWESFDNFMADMGIKPAGMSIERIENDGNYAPGNCIWADKRVQANNRRSSKIIKYKGAEYTMSELAAKFDIRLGTLWHRLKSGWDIEDALHTDVVIGRNQYDA